MWKSIAMGAAALAVLGATYLSAQPAPDQSGGQRPSASDQGGQRPSASDPRGGRRPPALSREDANAFLEARIAALHAGLQLTPDQERLWPAVEKAYRDFAKLRIERRFAARAVAAQQNEDPIARLQRRAAALTQEGAALKALADAAAPLWQSLDDSQKRRAAILLRAGPAAARNEGAGPGRFFGREGRDGGRFGFGRDGDRFGRDGRGFGGPRGRDDDRFGYGRDGDRFRDGRGFGDRFGYGRGFGDRFGYGRDGDRFGYGPRGFGDRYGYGRDGDRFGYGPRGFGGPGGRYGDEYGRFRGFGPGDYGRDFERGPFRGQRGFDRRWRDGRGPDDGDLQGGALGDPGGDRFSRDSDEDRL